MTYAGYNSHMQLGRKDAPDAAALGGQQLLMNGVPIRPMNMVGQEIGFDVAAPFRVSLGVLPAGAGVMGAMVAVTEVFDAGTTNVLVVGTLADPNRLVEAGDVDETAVGTTLVCHRGVEILTVDTEYFIWFTQTGAAATTGHALVGLMFAIP